MSLIFVMAALPVSGVSHAAAGHAPAEKKPPRYTPGMGLLEVFKTDSLDDIQYKRPSLVVPWMHPLACKPPASGSNIWQVREEYPDAFLVPECAYGLGARPGSEYSFPYIARITFHYEAQKPGIYMFTVWHGHNDFKFTVGDFLIANLPAAEPSGQGSCELKQGLYSCVLLITSNIYSGTAKNDPYFEVKARIPGAPDAAAVTRGMLFNDFEFARPRQ